MHKKNIGVIAAAIAIIGATAWYLQGGAEPAKSAATAKGAGQPPTAVNVVKPQRQDVPVVLQSNGSVTPVSSVELHPQTTSTIRTVHIKEGQFVKAGELMFSLDDRGDRANVDKARAQIARNQAALADVERQYKRSEELVAQKFLSQSAVDTLKSQVEAARALLAADQAALRSTSVSASYNTIRAPMAGRVGAINVFPGSLVQPATALTSVTQLDPINVAFTLPEAALGKLLAAQKSGVVRVEASAGDAGQAVTGTLSFIDNAVDPVAGTIRVKARFDNRDSSLWPGQYVTTKVTVQTLPNAVVIPQTAIITNTRGTFVYVVDADLAARQVPVERLHGFGLNAAVSGLAGDEQVITEGKQNLRPGGKVKPAEPAEPAGATRVARKDAPA
ncbi:efflux RND transporter periplasmic adaptor subunit [Massilia psychrophila]|uniref:Efflux transporter periplasmic adaptor subunit n=1 Tax=Massilia psychrophila TaxID=1603353 RepID=A0A2G8SZ85_9BURK|nr:efflux RND transporter periplasmic adaptor subunit [Massilia psychrophila]PIL39099.1 efflux transporter periplasmic adaptor subunit [Massilia psychrophila]GGE83305.1 RND efflux membrane fusion protein [Massilia psychrophila]